MKKTPLSISAATLTVQLKLRHIVIIIVSLSALVCGGIVLGGHLLQRDGIDRDAVEYPWTPPDGGESADGIAIPGYDTITLPANERTVDIILPNPSGNPCSFRFRMILKSTGETLYESGTVPPGMAVKRITLSRALEVGDYDLELQIETTSLADGTPMNGATLQVKLKAR